MSAGPVFTSVKQIAIVVGSLDEAMHRYADRYGLGPWDVHIYRQHPFTQPNGEVIPIDFQIALGMVGEVEFELIEPQDDHSMYAQFLREKGEGVQHIAFRTTDAPGQITRRDTGAPVDRAGHLFAPGIDGTSLEAVYYDTTTDLGFVAETHVIPDTWIRPEPAATYPPSR